MFNFSKILWDNDRGINRIERIGDLLFHLQYLEYNIDMFNYGLIFSTTDDVIKVAFGRSLKSLREHLNIRQVDLEEVTNIPRQSLSVYERGETAPTITQAYRIVRFFNLSIDDFIVYGMGLQEEILNENFSSITDKYDLVVKE